jgi:serine/threonine protein kinase
VALCARIFVRENAQVVKLAALFEQAVDLTTAQRGRFITELAATDAVAAAALADLLAAEQAPLLPEPDASVLRNIATALSTSPKRTVGGFQLQRPIGRGGMGDVWLASRKAGAATQEVALKILRFDLDTAGATPVGGSPSEHRLRFQLEQKIIASMNHPYVARMIDANHGISEGDGDELPWIAMEFVDGVNIADWCTQQQLSVRQRLALVIKVLEAVAHAHQLLIVHRDLKASNVMVTLDGTPKLLDFGIAKRMEDVYQTATAQRFFSIASVAPEQFSGARTSTATDIYQIGLLLYELLTGVPAHQIGGLAPSQIQEHILHRAPDLPSLSCTEAAAKACGLERKGALQRALSGELDRILMHSLRKVPTERYASAAEFARDLQAYLDGMPVLAAGQSPWYQARKFLTRHWLPASMAGFALVASFGLMLQLLIRTSQLSTARGQAELARDIATKERDKAQHLNTFLLDLFRAASPTASSKKDLSSIVLEAIDLQLAQKAYVLDPSAAFAMTKAALGLGELAPAKRLIAGLDSHRTGFTLDEQRQLLLLEANLANIEADFPRLKATIAALAPMIASAPMPQQITFIGYVGQNLVDRDPARVLRFTAIEPTPAPWIRLRARAFSTLGQPEEAVKLLTAARARADLTQMERIYLLQSLTLAHLALNQASDALRTSADMMAAGNANLGVENMRLQPLWVTRADALARNKRTPEAIAICDALLKWPNLSAKRRATFELNRLLFATSMPVIDAHSLQFAQTLWRGHATVGPNSAALAWLALIRSLAFERRFPEARALAQRFSPTIQDQPASTELRIWRAALTNKLPAACAAWRSELGAVASQDAQLEALISPANCQ